MSNLLIGLIAFGAIFGGALAGMVAARSLPEHHLSGETRTSVSVSTAIVGTLSALVLGLMISTASRSFTQRAEGLSAISSSLIRIDRLLDRYGPEAVDANTKLHAWGIAKEREMFPRQGQPPLPSDTTVKLLEAMQDAILKLAPADPKQTFLRSQALDLSVDLSETRWLLIQHSDSSIPTPFLILLIFWLSVVFASFGLFAPVNGTSIVALLLCSMAVAGGIALILELDSPFSGVVRISPEPMRNALHIIDD